MSHWLLDLPYQNCLLLLNVCILLHFIIYCGDEGYTLLNWYWAVEESNILGIFELPWVAWTMENEGNFCFAVVCNSPNILELAQGEDVYAPISCILY